MLARLQSLTIVRLWAALLLAAIGLQAAAPIAAPLEQRHGSAFGATTYEVALAIQRSERAVRQLLAPQPLAPLIATVASPPLRLAELPRAAAPRPDSTGPPLRDIRSWQAAPRAPPHD